MKILQLCIVIFTLLSGWLHAEKNIGEPDFLLQKVKLREDGKTRRAGIKLILSDQSGKLKERQVLFLERDIDQVRETRLLINSPVDIKGTALLLSSDADKTSNKDNIWLYIPALNKVKRLAAKNKRGKFIGSEFSYTDLEWLRVEDFRYTLHEVNDESGLSLIEIEAIAADKNVIEKTGYTKKILWVSPKYNLIYRALYFDERGYELKRMQVNEVKQVQGYWTITRQTVDNIQTGRKTEMIVDRIEYDLPLPDKYFRKQYLKREL